MGFFQLYKPKEYNHRYIYYDPKKEAQKERKKDISNEKDAEHRPTIRRGTFRAMAEKNKSARLEQSRQSNIRLVLIIVLLLAIAYFILR